MIRLNAFILALLALPLCVASCSKDEEDELIVRQETTNSGVEATDDNEADSISTTEKAEIVETTYETKEIFCYNNGKRIYGVAYIPQGMRGPMPLVIYSHGLGGTHSAGASYTRFLASHGVACYAFDFCGGSSSSQSDGSTTEMSIMTEKSDLAAVYAAAHQWNFVDTCRIALFGTSQGGLVSAMFAADHASEIAKLVLFYPALSIPDDARKRYSSQSDIPASAYFLYLTVGRIYFADILDYDPFTDIVRYDNPVLIVHGDRDGVIPIAYSERAAREYPSATLYTISGAGHGFGGDNMQYAANLLLDYLYDGK